MNNSTMIMEVAGNPHNPGDILHINYERWIVTKVDFNHTYSTVHLEPLANVLARNTIIPIDGYERYSIADYLKILCDEYEYDCRDQ
jgi:hypothetical protein